LVAGVSTTNASKAKTTRRRTKYPVQALVLPFGARYLETRRIGGGIV
jgi:hypothetical protein